MLNTPQYGLIILSVQRSYLKQNFVKPFYAFLAALFTCFAMLQGKAQSAGIAKSPTGKAAINYDSIIVRGWCQPHEMPFSYEFKKDGTFCEGYCGDFCKDTTGTTGTYKLTGADGWMTFKDGHKQKIHLNYEKYGFILFVYDPASTYYHRLN